MIHPDIQDRHIGDVYARFDIGCHTSPGVSVILPKGTDVEAITERLKQRIVAAIEEVLGNEIEYSNRDKIDVSSRSSIIVDRASRKRVWDDNLNEIRSIFADAKKQAQIEIAENPDNGKVGFWSVGGVRHETIVHSDTEANAIAKAIGRGDVGDWESARATYIGTEI